MISDTDRIFKDMDHPWIIIQVGALWFIFLVAIIWAIRRDIQIEKKCLATSPSQIKLLAVSNNTILNHNNNFLIIIIIILIIIIIFLNINIIIIVIVVVIIVDLE